MIRKISIEDKENWKKLYKGYADFYKSTINDKIFFILFFVLDIDICVGIYI